MRRALHERMGNTQQRGFWLRCFLGGAAAVLISLPLSLSAHSQGIVDCVSPSHISVSRVQGQVFDPSGVAVPGVTVSLVDKRGARQEIETDSQGLFHIEALPDSYEFKAAQRSFETASAGLYILGREDVGPRPDYLYVVLGMGGSFCPWVTASKHEFQRIIRDNKKRMREAAQQNATQK